MDIKSKIDNKKFHKLIKALIKSKLAILGFGAIGSSTVERDIDGLLQGLNFQSGNGWLASKFTVNVYWRFEKKENMTFDGGKRIGFLCNGSDMWFSKDAENIESEFHALEHAIDKYVIPYLEQYNSLEKLISSYNDGTLSRAEAFGADPGWQLYNLGLAYLNIGEYTDALREFTELTKFPTRNIEYEVNRKKKAQAYIKKIISKLQMA